MSTRLGLGIPCTISSFSEMHTLAGKPYSPLNADSAPGWLRTNRSAIRSRSAVVIPTFTDRRNKSSVSARIFPPAAITSTSRSDLS